MMRTEKTIVEINVHPGKFSWGRSGTRMRTVLGSCIAMCAWHPILGIGGMAHIMLPSRPRTIVGEKDPRYADEAAELFFETFRNFGTNPSDYQVKIFGGSSLLPGPEDNHAPGFQTGARIGRKNIEATLDIIKKHKLNMLANDVGGMKYRKIIFDLDNGDIWLKRMSVQTLEEDQPT